MVDLWDLFATGISARTLFSQTMNFRGLSLKYSKYFHNIMLDFMLACF